MTQIQKQKKQTPPFTTLFPSDPLTQPPPPPKENPPQEKLSRESQFENELAFTILEEDFAELSISKLSKVIHQKRKREEIEGDCEILEERAFGEVKRRGEKRDEVGRKGDEVGRKGDEVEREREGDEVRMEEDSGEVVGRRRGKRRKFGYPEYSVIFDDSDEEDTDELKCLFEMNLDISKRCYRYYC